MERTYNICVILNILYEAIQKDEEHCYYTTWNMSLPSRKSKEVEAFDCNDLQRLQFLETNAIHELGPI